MDTQQQAVEWSGNPSDPEDPFWSKFRRTRAIMNVARRTRDRRRYRKLVNFGIFGLPPSQMGARRVPWPKGV